LTPTFPSVMATSSNVANRSRPGRGIGVSLQSLQASWRMGLRIQRGSLEGRRAELAQILRRARSIAVDPDRVVLLTGEAGIGKTSLAREVCDRLGAEGFEIAWSRADQLERAVPYAAIEQALGSLTDASPIGD